MRLQAVTSGKAGGWNAPDFAPPTKPVRVRRRPARHLRFARETALPILVGALAGSFAGLLLWGVAAVRFGLPGLGWP